MPRYAAFLRGVMPTNCKMAELKKAFESAGFTDVVTVISSGNVVFNAPKSSNATLQRRAEAAMAVTLGREFLTFVRPLADLLALLARDPYAKFKLGGDSKRIVTFVREVPAGKPKWKFPVKLHGAQILGMQGGEIFGCYVPGDHGPEFMKLIEETFGRDVTTRTWLTVSKVAAK